TKWAERRNLRRDNRRIAEVGIVPGSSLTVIAKGSARKRPSNSDRRLGTLVKDLDAKLRSDGISVANISGSHHPRLLARVGPMIYGLYAMPGLPTESEDWIALARAGTARLEADRGVPITPVLVLDQEPPTRVMEAAAVAHVLVMWLDHGVLHDTPWARP